MKAAKICKKRRAQADTEIGESADAIDNRTSMDYAKDIVPLSCEEVLTKLIL